MGMPDIVVISLLPSLWLSLNLILFMTNFSFLIASSTGNTVTTTFDNVSNNNGDDITSSSSNPPPTPVAPPPQPQQYKLKSSPFRPSIAVIVGVLTTIFSVTFLLLLYAKHCRRGNNNAFSITNSRGYPPATARKNSGIDRTVIDSLPIFRFASLRGQKDGLECAVCLNRFEPTEVLRLLPKCKHAFHVECVDTWLDAHSTCPLCRYRVDPEDILLVEDNRIFPQSDSVSRAPSVQQSPREREPASVSRVSGRHSFAGSSLEVIVEAPKADATSLVPRRSLDSWNSRKKTTKNREEMVSVGCLDRPRKDGLLLADKTSSGGGAADQQRRLEHRIIISAVEKIDGSLVNQRWSDVQPSDLLFLRSEMILSDSRRFSRGSRPSVTRQKEGSGGIEEGGSGRNVINARSVSEITGLSRFRSNEQQLQNNEYRHRQAGAVSRWLANWISQSQQTQQQPAVSRTTSSSNVV